MYIYMYIYVYIYIYICVCFIRSNWEVSENGGTPQIIHAHRIFHYKQSILGYPISGKLHLR